MKKQIGALIFLLAMAMLLLASCGAQYRDDVPAASLADSGLSALADKVEYVTDGDVTMETYFRKPDYVTENVIRYARDTNNINEIGIYHVTDGNADAMKELLKNYLTSYFADNETWFNSYIPKETPKLRDAEVKVYGNYVVYAILNQTDRATFFDAVEKELAK